MQTPFYDRILIADLSSLFEALDSLYIDYSELYI